MDRLGISIMRITEVHVKLPEQHSNPRLLAYCSAVFNGDFAVHDIKLVQGNNGVILSMPSRRRKDHCPGCHHANEFNANYCSNCGNRLPPLTDLDVQLPERADVFHPLNSRARLWLQDAIWDAYRIKTGFEQSITSGG